MGGEGDKDDSPQGSSPQAGSRAKPGPLAMELAQQLSAAEEAAAAASAQKMPFYYQVRARGRQKGQRYRGGVGWREGGRREGRETEGQEEGGESSCCAVLCCAGLGKEGASQCGSSGVG